MRLIIPLLFVFIAVGNKIAAQTTGIGEVHSIESKAATIENNKTRIQKYNTELTSLLAEWKNKITKLKEELAALYKERDDLISDMKIGAKCSECGRYKSELEKEGIDFQQHLGEVKGYAIPASTEEIEAVRNQYKEKIAYKKVQIQNLEKGDKNVTDKQNQILQLEKDNARLCREITGHSQNYETTVIDEGKEKHRLWISTLMNYASAILIAEDKIAIQKARIAASNKELAQKSEDVKNELEEQAKQRQEKLKTQIAQYTQQLKDLNLAYEEKHTKSNSSLSELKTELTNIESQFLKAGTVDSLKNSLIARKSQTTTEIKDMEKEIQKSKSNYTTKVTAIQNETQKSNTAITQLPTELSQKKEAAIKNLQAAHTQELIKLNQAFTTLNASLAQAKKAYNDQVNYYTNANADFSNSISSETGRMLIAIQNNNCPVLNNAAGTVTTNWNQVLSCMNYTTSSVRSSGINMFNSYCQSVSSNSYLSQYKSFLSSLDPADFAAVKAISNSTWFNNLSK